MYSATYRAFLTASVSGAVLAAALCGSATAQTAADAGSSAQVSAASGSQQLEQIVVTARKRSERAQATPISVTAFNAAAIETKQISSVADIEYHTSGVTLQQSSVPQQFEISIRGQNTLDSTINLDPAIGIYVDGVYIGPDLGNSVATGMEDVESTEILKGPQGTLYGRNTSGGALKVDHVLPGYEYKGWFKLSLGDYDLHSVSGAVTVPIVDEKLTARLYGRYSEHGGYGENITLNRPLLDDRAYDFRATIRSDPEDDLQVILRAGFDKDASGGISVRAVADPSAVSLANLAVGAQSLYGTPQYIPYLKAVGGLFRGDYSGLGTVLSVLGGLNASKATALFQQGVAPNFYDQESLHPASATVKMQYGSLSIDYNYSDNLDVKSITGFRALQAYRSLDLTGDYYPLITTDQPLTYDQVTEEFNINGIALQEKLKYTVGIFYLYSYGHDVSLAQTAPFLLPTVNDEDGEERNESFATYAQGSYALLDNLNFTMGLRWTSESKDLTGHNRTYPFSAGPPGGTIVPAGRATCLEPIATATECSGVQNSSFRNVSYTFGLDYSPFQDVLTYVKASRGFRSGGPQLRLGGLGDPFKPETVEDYEVGVKADWLDHKLRTNVDLYHDDYQNFQKTFLQTYTVNGVTFINSTVQNAGKAEIDGMEYDLTAKPIDNLTLGLSGAYTYAHYLNYIDPGTGADLKGQHFQNVPKWTFSISANYQVPFEPGILNLELDYWHTSDVSLQPQGNNAWDVQKSYGLLNGRVAFDLNAVDMTVAFWAKNITDQKYFTYDLDVTPATSLGYASSWGGLPRTFGADITYRF